MPPAPRPPKPPGPGRPPPWTRSEQPRAWRSPAGRSPPPTTCGGPPSRCSAPVAPAAESSSEAALVRAAHQARIHGLHRAAAVARQCANRLQAAVEGQPQYRLADLTDDLRELLDLARRLRLPDPAGDLLGSARRSYETAGGLRLYGVCTVPVVADSGYGGVVTYLVDRDGRMWTVADLMPGGAERASTAGDGIVTIGEAVLSHRDLARAGLVVSGATSSDNGQLGAGKAVRAVRAAGAGWAEEPVDRLWREPFAEQVQRAFSASAVPVRDRPAGGDLLFLRVEVVGVAGDAVLGVTPDGLPIALTIASDHEALPYRDNLRVLTGAVGADLRVIGRLDPHRRTTVQALAIAPASPDAGLALPARWSGRADLGFDRLHRSHVRVDPTVPGVAIGPGGATGDPALHLLRRHVERVVDGGRAVQALAGDDGRRLRRARIDTGAVLLAELHGAAGFRNRDVFGRITADDGSAFAEAWLATAVYERAASAASPRRPGYRRSCHPSADGRSKPVDTNCPWGGDTLEWATSTNCGPNDETVTMPPKTDTGPPGDRTLEGVGGVVRRRRRWGRRSAATGRCA